MEALYSSKDLEQMQLPILPGTERGIRMMADGEAWPFRWESDRGGSCKMYRAHMLPDKVKKAILDRENINALVPVNTENSLIVASSNAVCAIKESEANCKASLVRLYLQALSTAPWGHKDQARDNFMIAYNSGAAYPELYKSLGQLSWKTVESWKNKLKKSCGNTLQLADRRGRSKGKRAVCPTQAGIILAVVCQPKGKSLPKSEIIRIAKSIMEKRGIDNLSDATYRRFLDDWIAVNYDKWTFWRKGEQGLNDDCSFWVERDYDKIDVGEIVVADGHILNFLIINPWTGKPQRMMLVLFFDMKSSMPLGWEIMPTENTASISAALRRAIIRLGKIPNTVYLDNGRAFKGQYFTGVHFEDTELPGLYKSIGIEKIIAKAYHGQSKTIERFFKTFGELERMSPSFVGTAIDTKPAHMNRGEKIHRRIDQKIRGDYVPSLIDSHRAIAAWFDLYAAREQGPNSHLAGLCPQEVFEAGRGPGVDPALLRVLMMKKIECKIYGRGVKVYDRGDWYYHPALYGRNHKAVVRYDLQDRESVLVYDQRTDEFICEAFQVGKVHPAASILGNDQDVAMLKGQLEMVGRLKKQTIAHAQAMAEELVIPEAQRLIEDSGFSPTPAVKKQVNNVKQLPVRPRQLTNEERQQALKEADEAQSYQRQQEEAQLCADLAEMSEADRYGRLLEMEMSGRELTGEWRRFMAIYEQLPEFERDRKYWDGQRAALAVLYKKNPATVEAAAG